MKDGRPNPPGIAAARRALKLEKRKPNDDDRPPPSKFPGPKRKPLPGQMTLGEDDAS
jgi:hypothetical protein